MGRSNNPRPFRCIIDHMNISFLGIVADHSLDLLFNHGTQRLRIHDLLAPNTLVNALPNRDEASEMGDLGADHLLIVRRI